MTHSQQVHTWERAWPPQGTESVRWPPGRALLSAGGLPTPGAVAQMQLLHLTEETEARHSLSRGLAFLSTLFEVLLVVWAKSSPGKQAGRGWPGERDLAGCHPAAGPASPPAHCRADSREHREH